MIKEVVKYLTIVALMLAIVACDRDDDNDDPEMERGTFEAAMTGDVQASLEGAAIFTEYLDETTGEVFFTLGMGTNAGEGAVNIWLVRGGAFPGEGTYTIQPFDLAGMEPDLWFFDLDEFVSFTIRQVNQQQQELYFAESGTITMELVDDDTALTGDFEIVATGSVMVEGEEGAEVEQIEIQFSGSYYAVFGTVQFPEFTFNQGQD